MFPAASLAVHVTVVEPTGNDEFDSLEHVGPDVTSVSSVAVTSGKNTGDDGVPVGTLNEISPKTETVGAVTSGKVIP